jgi:ABC-type nitrate/sulfonate/bicarbonate transport system permease component
MSKATVTRLFIGSVIAATAGAIVAILAVWLAIANDLFRADPTWSGSRAAPCRGP